MPKKSKKNIKKKVLGITIGILVIALFGLAVWLGVFQSTIGLAETQSMCNDWVKDRCAKSYYCKPCYKTTDVLVSTGTYGWTADCTTNSAYASTYTACGGSSMVTSHSQYHCYNGDVYWYNSNMVREELKADCGSGTCKESTYSSLYANCVAPETPTTPSSPTRTPASNFCITAKELCTKAYTDSSIGLTCDSGTATLNPTTRLYSYANIQTCADKCQNGACVTTPTCTNDCSQNGYMECKGVSSAVYRQCGNYDSDPCLEWKDFGCSIDKVCENNACVVFEQGADEPVADTCDSSTVCISEYSFETTKTDCSKKITSCPDGQKCDAGSCVNIPAGDKVPDLSVDLCKDVACQNNCDDKGTFNFNGVCNKIDGKCIYTDSQANSPQCSNTDKPIEPPKSGSEFIDKYGIYIGLGILALLVFYYFMMPSGDKGGK